MTPSPTNDTAVLKHPLPSGVTRCNSGMWVAKVIHPIRKVCVCVGIYKTLQEANDAYATKKMEYGLHTEQETTQFFQDPKKPYPGVYHRGSGKWRAEIKCNRVRVHLGMYNTAEEAAFAYHMSKLELEPLSPSIAYRTTGRLSCETRHPLDKGTTTTLPNIPLRAGFGGPGCTQPLEKGKNVIWGTFDTAEEAEEAYNSKRREFELMFPGHKRYIESKADAITEGRSYSNFVIGDPPVPNRDNLETFTQEAEDACEKMMYEFDLTALADIYSTVEVKKDATCVSSDPPAVITDKAEEDYINEDNNMTPSPTNDSAVLKHLLPPGVLRCKSGKWVAKVFHPIRKVWVCVGIYRTLQEANDACATKKTEYGLHTEQETSTFFQDPKKPYQGVYRRASGKWRAEIKCNRVKVSLGTYNTPEEAAFAYHMSKLELEPLSPCLAYQTSSGRWSCEIRHPFERAKNIILGSFDTAEEAEEAHNNKRHEFELVFPGHKRHIKSKADAIAEGRSYSTCVSCDPPVPSIDHLETFTQEAEDAYEKMMYEFELTARADINATDKVKSDATCVSSDLPAVPPDVITDKAEEAYNNVDDKMTPSPTNDTAVLKYLLPVGVTHCKSGMWVAKVFHPIRKVCVCVGIYRTLQEANDAYATKKMEYGLHTEQETTTIFKDPKKPYPGVYRRRLGKWRAEIECNKVRVHLGMYNTPEEAAFAYHMSKLELEPLSPSTAYRTTGRLSFETHPLEKGTTTALPSILLRAGFGGPRCTQPLEKGKNIIWGNFDTAEEAEEAYNNKRREFELMFPGHKRHIESKADAIAEGGIYSTCVSDDPPVPNRYYLDTLTHEAEDAFEKMMHEFELKAHADINATVGVKTDATYVSSDLSAAPPPFAFTDKAEEAYNNVDVIQESSSKESEKAAGNTHLLRQLDTFRSSGNVSNVDNKMNPSPTNDTAVLKHLLPLGVARCKSGMWVAKVFHPIRKVCVCVGIYRTLQEANDAYATKKMEYGLHTEQETASIFQDLKKPYPGVYRRGSGKWRAEIKCKKVRVHLGMYDTPEEAAFAYIMSKLELEPLSPFLAYQTRSGRWSCEIRGPLESAKKVNLGSFDTAEEAEEAYNNKRHIEFKADATAEGNTDHLGLFTREAEDAYTNMMYEFDLAARADIIATAKVKSDATCVSSDPPVVITDKAEEAYNNEMCEFDLMISADKKHKQLEDSSSGDSTCVSGDPPITTRDHLDSENAYTSIMREFDLMVHVDKKRKQSNTSCEDAHNKTVNEFKMMACVDDKASCEASAIVEDRIDSTTGSSVPFFLEEETTEFDLGVIDSHGRLIGEFSSLDDELWIS